MRRADDNFGSEREKGVVLQMETTINGDCPISLRPDTIEDNDENAWSAGAKVELSDFKEQVVQLDPSKGKILLKIVYLLCIVKYPVQRKTTSSA